MLKEDYLLRLRGTCSGEYLDTKPDELVGLSCRQLEGFFLAVKSDEFFPVYWEVDGQVNFDPKRYEPVTGRDRMIWTYTSDPVVWDIYWGDFPLAELAGALGDLMSAVSAAGVTAAEVSSIPVRPRSRASCAPG